MSLVFKPLDYDLSSVLSVQSTLNRRTRDPNEKNKPLLPGVVAEPYSDESKYFNDVAAVLPFFDKKKVNFQTIVTRIPTETFHYVQTTFLFKEPYDFSKIKEAFKEYPLCITVDAKCKLDMDYLNTMLSSKFNIKPGEITSPIYRLTRISDKNLLIQGFTPQMFIDTPSKIVYVLMKKGVIKNVQDGINLVAGKCSDGANMPIAELNDKLEELLNKKR